MPLQSNLASLYEQAEKNPNKLKDLESFLAKNQNNKALIIELGELSASFPIKNGKTLLHRAAMFGYPLIATAIIEHAKKNGNLEEVVNAQNEANQDDNKDDKTPLHFAADQGHLDIVKLLIQNGANMLLGKTNKARQIDTAMHGSEIEIFKAFLEEENKKLNTYMQENKFSPAEIKQFNDFIKERRAGDWTPENNNKYKNYKDLPSLASTTLNLAGVTPWQALVKKHQSLEDFLDLTLTPTQPQSNQQIRDLETGRAIRTRRPVKKQSNISLDIDEIITTPPVQPQGNQQIRDLETGRAIRKRPPASTDEPAVRPSNILPELDSIITPTPKPKESILRSEARKEDKRRGLNIENNQQPIKAQARGNITLPPQKPDIRIPAVDDKSIFGVEGLEIVEPRTRPKPSAALKPATPAASLKPLKEPILHSERHEENKRNLNIEDNKRPIGTQARANITLAPQKPDIRIPAEDDKSIFGVEGLEIVEPRTRPKPSAALKPATPAASLKPLKEPILHSQTREENKRNLNIEDNKRPIGAQARAGIKLPPQKPQNNQQWIELETGRAVRKQPPVSPAAILPEITPQRPKDPLQPTTLATKPIELDEDVIDLKTAEVTKRRPAAPAGYGYDNDVDEPRTPSPAPASSTEPLFGAIARPDVPSPRTPPNSPMSAPSSVVSSAYGSGGIKIPQQTERRAEFTAFAEGDPKFTIVIDKTNIPYAIINASIPTNKHPANVLEAFLTCYLAQDRSKPTIRQLQCDDVSMKNMYYAFAQIFEQAGLPIQWDDQLKVIKDRAPRSHDDPSLNRAPIRDPNSIRPAGADRRAAYKQLGLLFGLDLFAEEYKLKEGFRDTKLFRKHIHEHINKLYLDPSCNAREIQAHLERLGKEGYQNLHEIQQTGLYLYAHSTTLETKLGSKKEFEGLQVLTFIEQAFGAPSVEQKQTKPAQTGPMRFTDKRPPALNTAQRPEGEGVEHKSNSPKPGKPGSKDNC